MPDLVTSAEAVPQRPDRPRWGGRRCVTDELPAGLTFNGVSNPVGFDADLWTPCTVNLDDDAVTCQLVDDLPAGETASFTLTAATTADAVAQVTNSAEVVTSTPETDETDNDDVEDQVFTCELDGDLEAGEDAPTITVEAQIDAGFDPEDTLTNEVEVVEGETHDPDPDNDEHTSTTDPVGAEAALTIEKSLASEQLVAGETGRYRIEVGNEGPRMRRTSWSSTSSRTG